MSRPVPFVSEVALVTGPAARAAAALLGMCRARGEFSALPAGVRRQLEDAVEAMRLAGESWARRVADGGNGGVPIREVGAGSACGDPGEWVDVVGVAAALGLSVRRARQLAAAELGGRLVGGRWVVPAEALIAETKARRR